MLFNSYEFIFIFLPLLLILSRVLQDYLYIVLIGASIVFYAMLDAVHLPILIMSALINYSIGHFLASKTNNKLWIVVGIVFNIGLLAGYKYIGFFTSIIDIKVPHIGAPLGISFFTFHQLAYLIDIYAKRIKPTNFRDYALYVTFFPHLIAGPIMRYGQFVPQLYLNAKIKPPYGVAFLFFSTGLFKKVVLADTFAPIVDRIFGMLKTGQPLSFLEAWKGLFAYTWQIYFDFSGYADMAIGLGLFFGIALPINFLSPYKAISISDFWRRWHISLSQFLRDYLYIPLGGNRYGRNRQIVALFFTMTLAGLWHGAAWTFIIWGMLHGALLILALGWRQTSGRYITIPPTLGTVMTFVFVMLLWVLFRAENIHDALMYYKSLSLFSYEAIHQPVEWLWVISAGILVFTCKPVISWVNYNDKSLDIENYKVSFLHGIFAGIVLLLSLKAMSGEVSRSFVYFVF